MTLTCTDLSKAHRLGRDGKWALPCSGRSTDCGFSPLSVLEWRRFALGLHFRNPDPQKTVGETAGSCDPAAVGAGMSGGKMGFEDGG